MAEASSGFLAGTLAGWDFWWLISFVNVCLNLDFKSTGFADGKFSRRLPYFSKPVSVLNRRKNLQLD